MSGVVQVVAEQKEAWLTKADDVQQRLERHRISAGTQVQTDISQSTTDISQSKTDISQSKTDFSCSETRPPAVRTRGKKTRRPCRRAGGVRR